MIFSDKFISFDGEFCTREEHVNAPLFRKVFCADQNQKTEITICGLGFYQLFINGVNVTKGLLAPYISNPNHIIYYDNYDISKRVRQGKNVIVVILGIGFQNSIGGDIWEFDKADFKSCPKLSLCVESGGKVILQADETFVVAKSPITFDDLRAGEHYDANLIIKDVHLAEYDDSDWARAIEVKSDSGRKKLVQAEPILVEKEIEVQNIIKVSDGYIYDFGENNAGVCRLRISGRKEQKITLVHSEMLLHGISFRG